MKYITQYKPDEIQVWSWCAKNSLLCMEKKGQFFGKKFIGGGGGISEPLCLKKLSKIHSTSLRIFKKDHYVQGHQASIQ